MHIMTKQAVHRPMSVPCIEPSCYSVFDGNPGWCWALAGRRVWGIGTKNRPQDWASGNGLNSWQLQTHIKPAFMLLSTSFLCCAVNVLEERSFCFLDVLTKPRKSSLTHAQPQALGWWCSYWPAMALLSLNLFSRTSWIITNHRIIVIWVGTQLPTRHWVARLSFMWKRAINSWSGALIWKWDSAS